MTPEDAWSGVLARDRSLDGTFVYAVRTTGIYCLPSCISRKPLRQNVDFFPDSASAELAGFRPCKRCRPESETGTARERSLRKALEYIDAHLDEPITLEQLASAVAVSPFHLQRTFKEAVGLSPKRYQDARRAERFKERLKQGETVSRATYEAGFGSSRGAYERTGPLLGMTPGAYRRGGAGMEIRFTVTDCPFGRLLVGATDRGVCTVTFGSSEAELLDGLRREFPNATIVQNDVHRDWVDAIVGQLEGQHPGRAIPLDLQGTTFQLRVWEALRGIPVGETRSYGEVAAALGQPTASRAVARACASNRAAVVVPCHRVIRDDGSLSGYRWGVERKRRLLELERGSVLAAANPGEDQSGGAGNAPPEPDGAAKKARSSRQVSSGASSAR